MARRTRRSPRRARARTVTRYRTRCAPRVRRAASRARGLLRIPRLNPMNLAVGAGGLLLAARFQPFGGAYKPALDKVATGVALNAVGMDNSDLITVGLKEGIATLANGYLSGSGFSGASLYNIG